MNSRYIDFVSRRFSFSLIVCPIIGFPATPGAVVVRAEEALIVVFVLVLWIAAIALFFNRWGKIRSLEPYQPKFQQQHRQSCVIVEPTPLPVSRFSSGAVIPSSILIAPRYTGGYDTATYDTVPKFLSLYRSRALELHRSGGNFITRD